MSFNLSTSLQANVNLQALNTLSVPAVAEWFYEVTRQGQLLEVLSIAKQHDLPLTIIGGGSNIILPEVVTGIVLKNALLGRSIVSNTDEDVVIECAAGESWHETVMWCVDKGYYGIENLALIPGSIGAAPIQNIGAYGVELESCFEYLDAVDIASGEIIRFTKEQCQFGYRDSVFKHALQDKMVILSVALRLQKRPRLVLDYMGLSQMLDSSKSNASTVNSSTVNTSAINGSKVSGSKTNSSKQAFSAKDVANAVISIRRSKLPNPSDIPNVGSFFKNPVVSEAFFQSLKSEYSDIAAYLLPDGQYKLAAGWLLEKEGWKGKVVDGISMHEQQALVLTNPNCCSGRQILLFAEQVCDSVKQEFGIHLEIEPRVYV